MTLKETLSNAENAQMLQEKLQAAGKDPEKVYAILKEGGLSSTFEEFQKEVQEVRESMTKLSEDELAMVSGGLTDQQETSLEVAGVATGLTAMLSLTAAFL